MKKSMLVDHPLWDKSKPTKEFKEKYKKAYGLIATEIYTPNDKHSKLLEEVFIKG